MQSNIKKCVYLPTEQIPGVPELPHDILLAYSGVKIKTKIERKNAEGPIVSIP
jgi:hypothetical protein